MNISLFKISFSQHHCHWYRAQKYILFSCVTVHQIVGLGFFNIIKLFLHFKNQSVNGSCSQRTHSLQKYTTVTPATASGEDIMQGRKGGTTLAQLGERNSRGTNTGNLKWGFRASSGTQKAPSRGILQTWPCLAQGKD